MYTAMQNKWFEINYAMPNIFLLKKKVYDLHMFFSRRMDIVWTAFSYLCLISYCNILKYVCIQIDYKISFLLSSSCFLFTWRNKKYEKRTFYYKHSFFVFSSIYFQVIIETDYYFSSIFKYYGNYKSNRIYNTLTTLTWWWWW